jgi:hypothetical protein
MIISKKLFIVNILILSVQCGAYDVSALNNETALILSFAQTLREVDNKHTSNIAQWLEQQVCDTSYNVQDHDIVAMANVINNSVLTIESKISVLSQIMANQKKEQTKKTVNNVVSAAIVMSLIGGFAALIITSIIQEIRNPTPKLRIYVEHKFPTSL